MNLRPLTTIRSSIRSRGRRTAALGAAVLAIVVYPFLPGDRWPVAYVFAAVTSCGVLALSARQLADPAVRRFGAGVACLVAGDLFWGVDSGPSVIRYGSYYLGYALLFAALTGIARRAGRSANRDLAVDVTLAVLVGIVALTQLVLLPYGDSAVSVGQRLLDAVYPLLDLVLVSLALGLALRGQGLPGFTGPVTAGLLIQLIGDTGFAIARQRGPYEPGTIVDVAWLSFYVLAAAGSLAATVESGTAPSWSAERRRTGGLAVLTLAVVATPVVDFVAARQAGRSGSWTAAAAVVVAVAVMVRVRLLWSEADSATEGLRSSEARFRSLVQNSADIVTIHRPDGHVLYTSPNLGAVLGYADRAALPSDPFDLVHPDDREMVAAAFAACLERPGRDEALEFRLRDVTGRWRWLEGIRDNRLDDPDVAGIVVTCRDVTAHKETRTRLVHQAHYDPLTGLPNQTLLRFGLAEALDRRQRGDEPLAVLFVDLDRFKNVNDTLGHSAGDELLVEAGKRLRAGVRATDTVARFGGDEFVVVVEGLDSPATEALVHRLLGRLSAPYRLTGAPAVYASATVGVRFADDGDTTLEDLLRDADTAMYAAKASGRGGCRFFDGGLRLAAVERAELEHDLRQGIDRDEIVTVLQPIVAVADRSVTGAEALVRWSHPRLGLLSPDRFLTIAEEAGLIVPIGATVLRQACQAAAAWEQRSGHPLTMAVNLSAAQLARADFAASVAEILADTGLASSRLKLELTEQVLMADTPVVRENFRALRALGVGFAVDDFGTGFSSLTYLHRFELDTLKIDRTFVAGVPSDPGRTKITTAVLGLADSLGLTSVGEGVETEEQLEWLRGHGCEEAQGYLFSPPVRLEEFEARFVAPVGVPHAA